MIDVLNKAKEMLAKLQGKVTDKSITDMIDSLQTEVQTANQNTANKQTELDNIKAEFAVKENDYKTSIQVAAEEKQKLSADIEAMKKQHETDIATLKAEHEKALSEAEKNTALKVEKQLNQVGISADKVQPEPSKVPAEQTQTSNGRFTYKNITYKSTVHKAIQS